MFLGFFYKLVTTGKETKDTENIETVTEEPETEANGQLAQTPLVDNKTKSNRKMHKRNSVRGDILDAHFYGNLIHIQITVKIYY